MLKSALQLNELFLNAVLGTSNKFIFSACVYFSRLQLHIIDNMYFNRFSSIDFRIALFAYTLWETKINIYTLMNTIHVLISVKFLACNGFTFIIQLLIVVINLRRSLLFGIWTRWCDQTSLFCAAETKTKRKRKKSKVILSQHIIR